MESYRFEKYRGVGLTRRFFPSPAKAIILLGLLAGFLGRGHVLARSANVTSAGGGPSHVNFPPADHQTPNLQVPVGTVLPIRLNHGISSKDARVGQTITGRIMQDVPLLNGRKIPEGARVLGTIASVSPPGKGGDGKISLRFNEIQIHQQRIAIVTTLRAMASPMEVQFAQIPETPAGFGTPYAWVTTKLVGGGVKYGVGGPVTDSDGNTVGEGTYDGVLVHTRAQTGSVCSGAQDAEDRLQALWVFSADACGLYGIPRVRIDEGGRTEADAEITLSAETGDIKIRGGTGMLLRVLR